MVVVFIKTTETLRVHNQHIDSLAWSSGARDRGPVNMDAFCARVDAWTHTKSSLAIQKHTIQQVTFSCAVHSCDRNDANGTLNVVQKLNRILVHLKHWIKNKS